MRKACAGFLLAALSVVAVVVQAMPSQHIGSGPTLQNLQLETVSDTISRTFSGAKVNVTHQAIPSISWPKMTMDIALFEGARIRGVRPGDRAWIVLATGPGGVYGIQEIAPRSGPKPAAPPGAVVAEGVVNAMP